MKKILVLLLLVISVTVFYTSCGGDDSSDLSSDVTQSSSEDSSTQDSSAEEDSSLGENSNDDSSKEDSMDEDDNVFVDDESYKDSSVEQESAEDADDSMNEFYSLLFDGPNDTIITALQRMADPEDGTAIFEAKALGEFFIDELGDIIDHSYLVDGVTFIASPFATFSANAYAFGTTTKLIDVTTEGKNNNMTYEADVEISNKDGSKTENITFTGSIEISDSNKILDFTIDNDVASIFENFFQS